MTRRSVSSWAAVALLASTAGCAALGEVAKAQLRKHTPGGTSALFRQLSEEAIDTAVKALEQAWAERREADARAEEARRLRVAEAQLFYADLCTQRGTSLDPKAAAAGRGSPTSASGEKGAEAAYAAGQYARASALLQAAYDERKASLGEEHREVARIANRLAIATLAAGDAVQAMRVAMGGLTIRSRILANAGSGKQDAAQVLRARLDVAESESTVAQIYRSGWVFGEARRHFRHALEVRLEYLGAAHLCAAQSQNDLGELEYLTGGYSTSMELYRQALVTREKQLPDGHRDLAQSYSNLGSLHRAVALYEPARSYYERALANRRRLGEDHPEVADSYHELAALFRVTGDFSQAEAFYERALSIRRARAPDGLEVAATETALAELSFSYGDYDKAEGLLEHAHRIRKALLPADHPDLAESLSDLARLHQAKLEFDKAEQDDREALAIWERRFGPEHVLVAGGADALGGLYLAQGRLDEAEPHLVRARTLRTRKLGAEHPATAESLHQLGVLYYARYDYGRAEPLFRSAVEIRRKTLGESHPEVAASLSYLAALLIATGRDDEALKTFRRAQLIAEQLVASVGSMASEARLDALLRFLRAQEEVVYSLLQERELALHAASLALSVALLRKGRSIDEAASISQAVYLGLGGQDRAMFDELRALRGQIARQKLSPVGSGGPQETEQLGKQLADRAERLELELAKRSAPIRARRQTPALDHVVEQVAAALPPGAALVEFVKYRAYRFKGKPKEPRWGEARYVAMVLGPNGGVQVADLGPAASIDEGVNGYLEAITRAVDPAGRGEADRLTLELSQRLEARVMRPIRPFLANSQGMVLSPDGQLNLLPFSALFDGKAYLADSHEVTYVTSGRDLLPRQALAHSREVVLFGKPAFARHGVKVAQVVAPGPDRGFFEVVEDPKAGSPITRLAPGALKLRAPPSPLPGTEQEARAVRKLLPRAKLVLGAEATKETFLALQGPRLVHVGTHGLFRAEAVDQKGNARALELRGLLLSPVGVAARRSEPLLNSMLLWANVSTPLPAGSGAAVVLDPSGLATALEVAGMNLWGTQLVVLSACETGRGQVDELGQGVYGLRRAVMVAGAESLVTSLWKVDDEVTRDLMTSYYVQLLAGSGRGEALRQASLTIRRKHPEPRFWAPFIAIGQVGPMQGLR